MEIVRRFVRNQEQGAAEGDVRLSQADDLLRERMRGEIYSCRLRRLSEVMREEQVSHIDLLKVDVERAEWDVLQGINAEDWQKIDQIVLEAHDHVSGYQGSRVKQISEFLQEQGYEVTAEEDDEMKGAGPGQRLRHALFAGETGKYVVACGGIHTARAGADHDVSATRTLAGQVAGIHGALGFRDPG